MEYSHLGKLVFENAKAFGGKTAFSYKQQGKGNWKDISWMEMQARVERIIGAFLSIGLNEGDKIGVCSQNMIECVEIDLAAQALRAVVVPMYATSSASQIKYIVDDAEIETIFVGEQYQYDNAIEVLHASQSLKRIVCIDPNINLKGEEKALTYRAFIDGGVDEQTRDKEIEARRERLSDEDLATLIYTSGTTGEPKGVMLTHANYKQAMKIHDICLTPINDTLTSLSFLPMCHVFERAWLYYCMHRKVKVYINTYPKEIQTIMKEVRPNMMCAVPRFWEKIYSGVNEKVDTFPLPLKKLTKHAISIGRKRNLDYASKGLQAPTLLEWRYKFYENTLFKTLKKVIGLENGMLFPCAGSQLSDEVNIFLHSVGFNIVVGYGLTESTATVSCFNPENKCYDIKSVGDIMPEVEVKISEDNEILLRGKTITNGYYKKPEANKSSFTEDGWFRTGDAGYITPEGRLVMTERIKELFKTSNGKYIAPQHIENKLVIDKFIEEVAIIGDLRKYVTALVIPAYDALKAYADENGVAYSSTEDLLQKQEIHQLIEEHINACQQDLAPFEQVKKFTLLSKPFSMENGELTNTLKMKRKVIYEHYAKEIKAMYEE